jgi:hypothetical protein
MTSFKNASRYSIFSNDSNVKLPLEECFAISSMICCSTSLCLIRL